MVQYRYHALASMAFFAASRTSPTAAFQTPKPNTKSKASLDVSFVDRTMDQPESFFAPAETFFEDMVADKSAEKKTESPASPDTGGMACMTDLEKRLQSGVAFEANRAPPVAETPRVTQELADTIEQEQMVSSAFAVDLAQFSGMERSTATAPAAAVIQETPSSAVVVQEQEEPNPFAGLDLSKISNVLSPPEAFEALVQKGEFNAASSTEKILFSSALGGCYVGMGAMVSLAVAGNSPDLAAADPGLQKLLFAALFPMNLLLAQQCGGSLYTGNTANMMAAVCEKRATFGDMGRVLGLSWVGNIVGCSVFAVMCKYAGVMEGGAGVLAAATLATKTSYELGPLFVKAMFCNWLVCLAVLLSTQAKDMGGKYISIWLPVSTFVSIGFEHSVANMFLLPAGLMSQHDITVSTALFHNLIPVTIGNAFSGALLVGATMSYLYGSLGNEEKTN